MINSPMPRRPGTPQYFRLALNITILVGVIFIIATIGFVNFGGRKVSIVSSNFDSIPNIAPKTSVMEKPANSQAARVSEFDPRISVRRGQRAVTVPLDLASREEGLVRPGLHVDVVYTHVTSNGELTTSVLAENARVLSLGGDTEQGSFGKQGKKGATITLEVRKNQVLELMQVAAMLPLRFLVRSPGDQKLLPQLELSSSVISSSEQSSKEERRKGRLQSYCPTSVRSKAPVGRKVCTKNCDSRRDPLLSDCYH